ncbi:hypothetical protein JW824_05910 [bacterium]|nr:hypothetical protein [bacterium]RQV95999.1 MAG: hypothetical protein EH221_05470 [bacterium]
MEKHITLVAAIHIGFGILGMFVALIVFTAIVGGGILSGDSNAMAITSIVGTVIAFFLSLKSIPEIIGGIGLLKRKSWARIVVLIIGCLDLIEIPIGTAIGAYTIWVLLNEESVKLFSKNYSR